MEVPVKEIVSEVVNLGREINFDLAAEDVTECLNFDEGKMSNEDLFAINEPMTLKDEDENGE